MRLLRSFRSRVILAATLWTFGLLAGGHVTMYVLLRIFPEMGLRPDRRLHLTAGLAMIALVSGVVLLRRSFSPFGRLRARLGDVRDARERRGDGDYPTEVQPLVDDLNALLHQREEAVARAIRKAGDFAHGLKTPLAVLAQEAERVAAAGERELAATIQEQVERMRRQVEYHLAHARAAGASSTSRCALKEVVEALARTLLRLNAGRGLAIETRVEPDHAVRGEREDVDEMLGNLLDNACKWARSRVVVTSTASDETIVLDVDDDGPGLAPELRLDVLRRGVRADEATPGSGLGLAIVRDLAELHGGSIELDASPLGGLRARLRLPR